MKVFISYQHEDVEFARKLSSALEQQGFQTWFSQKPNGGLKREEDWRERSERELDTSAVMLAVISEKSVLSESLVHEEYAFATEHKVRVIPIEITSVKTPFPLSDLQSIDFVNRFDDAVQELIMVLQANPYAARGMIRNPSQFFGREKELREIFTRLTMMLNISLVGERRIGKSSLLYHIFQSSRENLGTTYISRYLDMQRILSANEFFARACDALEIDGENHLDFERALKGKRVILCLDEFEQATNNSNFGTDFFAVLRSLAQTGELALVVATQHELSDLFISGAILTSPFQNVFALLRLGKLTQTEAIQAIQVPAEKIGKPFTDDEIRFIGSLAGTHPFRLNIASALVFDEKTSGQVNLERVGRNFQAQIGKAIQIQEKQPQPLSVDEHPGEVAVGFRVAAVFVVIGALVGWISIQTYSSIGLFFAGGFFLIALALMVMNWNRVSGGKT